MKEEEIDRVSERVCQREKYFSPTPTWLQGLVHSIRDFEGTLKSSSELHLRASSGSWEHSVNARGEMDSSKLTQDSVLPSAVKSRWCAISRMSTNLVFYPWVACGAFSTRLTMNWSFFPWLWKRGGLCKAVQSTATHFQWLVKSSSKFSCSVSSILSK